MRPERIRGIRVNEDGCAVDDLSFCGAVTVTIDAHEEWDGFVATAVDREWVGLEALSGIQGTVGDAVTRNASAYGGAVADTLASVRTWDRVDDAQRTFAAADCGLSTGTSRFEADPDRYEVLDAAFLLRQGDLSAPITDAGLAAVVGVEPGQRVPLAAVRTAVLGQAALR